MSLYVEESGTQGAPSIVWLHGIGASGWMWGKQIPALAEFHSLNVDLPGHGRSNRVPWISLADTAAQIALLIEAQASGGRAHVVGLSLGGQVALALLERHAALLDHVVMSGVTVSPMPYRSLLGLQLWLTTRMLKDRRRMARQAGAMGVPPEMQADFLDGLQSVSLDAYRRIWHEVAGCRLSESLKQVATPVLVAAGARESPIIHKAVGALPHGMPHAQGCFAPDCGHGWNVEAPALFTAMVRAWLTNAPLPQRLQLPHSQAS